MAADVLAHARAGAVGPPVARRERLAAAVEHLGGEQIGALLIKAFSKVCSID